MAKGTKGSLTSMPSSTTMLSYISSSSLLFPSITSLSSSSSFFSSPFSSFSPYFRRFVRPPGPRYLLQGPVEQALGFLHTDLALSSPLFQNNDRFEIIPKLHNCDWYYKTLTFKCLSSWQNLKN